jgi:hypothetical protein
VERTGRGLYRLTDAPVTEHHSPCFRAEVRESVQTGDIIYSTPKVGGGADDIGIMRRRTAIPVPALGIETVGARRRSEMTCSVCGGFKSTVELPRRLGRTAGPTAARRNEHRIVSLIDAPGGPVRFAGSGNRCSDAAPSSRAPLGSHVVPTPLQHGSRTRRDNLGHSPVCTLSYFFSALRRNSTKPHFYATFRKATNSVFVTARCCTLSNR